jgi:orc1/cdc6 family replication initiation protein
MTVQREYRMSGPFEGLEETIFVDKSVLDEEYQPDKILERDEEIKEYRNALKDVLFGRNPSNVFLYGKSGVGKSVVTTYILDALQEAVSENEDADELHVRKLNCNDETAFSATRSLVNDLRPPDEEEFPKRGLGIADAQEELYREMDRIGGTFLFVLDEIDHLTNVDTMLYELPRARANGELENARVGIIGISNNYSFRKTLSPKVKGTLMEKEISFTPYDAHELETILTARAENALADGAYTQGSIGLCSAVAARDTGSARQAIDLLREGGDLAEERGDKTVTEEHIEDARDAVRRGRITARIREQTHHAQLILEAVAHLEEDGETPVKSKRIKEKYGTVAYRYEVEPLSTLKSVQKHLSDLKMLGFLSRDEHNDGLSGGSYFTYTLELSPNEVIDIRERIENQ